MKLEIIDWIIIAAYFILSLLIGLAYKKRASGSLTDFFLSGRNLPWYIAGISMVATTFAADTPLAVTELVAKSGISGNWLWWNMLIGGMLTVFFFAKLWRRANILTDTEFIELRYSGKAAGFLRGFKAIYMGVFMNSVIIGWVNIALLSILQVFFGLPKEQLIWYAAVAMLITALYSTISGLWGVAITDAVQFIIAMTGCIILAVIVLLSPEIGGITGLKAKLPAETLNFFPKISMDNISGGVHTLTITIGSFLAFIGMQWWASWYPGAEPGGGGYIAQRMMSTRTEKDSLFATLFFQVAHYCIRPWPWIIVGLATIVLYPELTPENSRFGYVMVMNDFLPAGLKGMLLVAFLAAYMSTVATQLNWGASYLVNDLYKRFIRNEASFKDKTAEQKNYVLAGRLFTILVMFISLYATTQIKSISGVWEFVLECGAGLGLVLILRWFWWRINVWSEITATIAPFIGYGFVKLYLENHIPQSFIDNRFSFYFTVGFTTISWITVTFLTKPTEINHLRKFHTRVKPEGYWQAVTGNKKAFSKESRYLLFCWISSIIMTYSILFFIGELIFQNYFSSSIYFVVAFCSFFILRKYMNKI